MQDPKQLGPVRFVRDRETPRKVLFREQDTNHIGGLYLRKEAVKALGDPQGVVLRIVAAQSPGQS